MGDLLMCHHRSLRLPLRTVEVQCLLECVLEYQPGPVMIRMQLHPIVKELRMLA